MRSQNALSRDGQVCERFPNKREGGRDLIKIDDLIVAESRSRRRASVIPVSSQRSELGNNCKHVFQVTRAKRTTQVDFCQVMGERGVASRRRPCKLSRFVQRDVEAFKRREIEEREDIGSVLLSYEACRM